METVYFCIAIVGVWQAIVSVYAGKVPVKQHMASGFEVVRSVHSKGEGDADRLPLISSDTLGVDTGSGTAQCNSGDTLRDKKWEFRPPPRGLTPNEYILCHR